MTRKDAAPTYTVAISRKGGRLHLSEDDNYTLCHWVIRPYWQRHDANITLSIALLSGVGMCSQCVKLAQKATP